MLWSCDLKKQTGISFFPRRFMLSPTDYASTPTVSLLLRLRPSLTEDIFTPHLLERIPCWFKVAFIERNVCPIHFVSAQRSLPTGWGDIPWVYFSVGYRPTISRWTCVLYNHLLLPSYIFLNRWDISLEILSPHINAVNYTSLPYRDVSNGLPLFYHKVTWTISPELPLTLVLPVSSLGKGGGANHMCYDKASLNSN